MLLTGEPGFASRMPSVGMFRSSSPSRCRESEPTYAISNVVVGAICCCTERLKSAYDGTLKAGVPVVVSAFGPRPGGAAAPTPVGLSNEALLTVVVCTSGGSPNAFCSQMPLSVRSKNTPNPPRRTVLASANGVQAKPTRGPKFQLLLGFTLLP